LPPRHWRRRIGALHGRHRAGGTASVLHEPLRVGTRQFRGSQSAGRMLRGPRREPAPSVRRYAAMSRAWSVVAPTEGMAVPGSTLSGEWSHRVRFSGVLMAFPAM